MNRRLVTASAWIVLVALLVLGSRAWPTETPWFLLIGFAASEEAIFLIANKPTLSRRYWSVHGRAKVILNLIVAAAMVILFLHLAFGLFR